MKIILQKLIAQSGLCSRRQADDLIRRGLVKINGEIAEIGMSAELGIDKVTVKGKPLGQKAKPLYIKLNKPAGYTCTNRRFAGEKNIFDLIPGSKRLFCVGRLDKDSRGLVLLTNDGDVALKLTHPRYEKEKIYEVRLKAAPARPESVVKELLKGVEIGEGDGIARARKAQYLQSSRFIITLNEGKKRQIRRMFQALGLSVQDLARVAIGPLSLGNLPEGKWRALNEDEIKSLNL